MTGACPRLHNEVYPFIYPAKFKQSLTGKVTVITGSAGTLGRALAECFSVAGARLALVYNRTLPPPDLETRCRSLGASTVTLLKCDVSDLESCKKLVEKVEESVGPVDILINNAGLDATGPLHLLDPQEATKCLSVNLLGPYFLMRSVVPGFMERGHGCVINIASRGGTVDLPFNSIYSVGKSALIRLTSCWQKELDLSGKDDIHMYSIHPGAVPSDLTSPEALGDWLDDYPYVAADLKASLKGFKDSPYLGAMVSVALATGIAKGVLKGRYFDAQQDLENIISQAELIKADPELYTLHTKFLGGLENNGGTEHLPAEDPFDFIEALAE